MNKMSISKKIQKLEMQKPQVAKTILRQNNKAGGLILSDFKVIWQSCSNQEHGTGIKTDINKCNRIAQKYSNYTFGQMIFDKGAKTTNGE